ncbi:MULTISPECIES: amino acid ABC transporter permease [unclassified Pseudomonas]|uniref:amino acid ABC transporter permease n=1 Tax=unclassified Pseudomonas TaxID=196821 RepID=UPI0015A27B78|nr:MULTISPECIES: amino acid ABC transporter permease [unclassified Pseudomonas]NWC96812.1 amino acid ABC transporter permease [Pseudomonas sp. IPO3779]NWD21205.1 amino acid ABC transporter permease [Pseudomonas sp. IPO3778]
MNSVPLFSGLQANDLLYLLQGAGHTLWLALWAIVLGTVLGFLMGWLRSVSKIGNGLIMILVDVSRSVPLLIQLIVVNAALAAFRFPLSPFLCSALVLTLYMASFCSEIYKGGFEAVPQNLQKAARSLGMSYLQAFVSVTAPIMLRRTFASWIGIVLGVLKDTSLAAVIGYIELLRGSQIIVTRTQEPLLVLLIVGVFYFLLCYPIARLGAKVEKGLSQ